MKVLGIRNSPAKIRFCILEGDAAGHVFSNCAGEHKIDLPKALKLEAEIYTWLKSEYERLFDKYGPFDHLAIKQNENVPTRYASIKSVMFMDCIATMVAIQNNTSFSSHLYSSLGTNSKAVMSFVEAQCQRTSINWDNQIADAVLAAIKNLK